MIGLLGFAAIFGVAWVFGLPSRRAWIAAALWWVLLLAAHAPAFGGGALARLTGGEFAAWVLLGPAAGLIWLYRQGLRRLRERAAVGAPAAPVVAPSTFSEAELSRYARHIILREIGGPGQKRLKQARVLVVGAGGLGSPALLYLAAAGVGTIGVVDDDVVEASNLQRQVIHSEDRLGRPKVDSAAAAMRALNPHVEVRTFRQRLDETTAAALVADFDLVLDGTDNFDTRYLLNRVCAGLGKPLVAGAITQWEGQLSVWDPARGAPCYECVFPTRPAPGMVPTCAEAGVAAPLPGVIGSMMAMEALKLVTGAGEPLRGRLLIHDALYAETRVIGVKRRADCPACGGMHG